MMNWPTTLRILAAFNSLSCTASAVLAIGTTERLAAAMHRQLGRIQRRSAP
jgi:hypothetical protein